MQINESEQKSELPVVENQTQLEKSPSRQKLESWLNRNMRIEMTDGRTLVGIFLCTDRERNIILGSCAEYLQLSEGEGVPEEEPRVLGLAMVPGHHIVSIQVDLSQDAQVL
ncbi:N-alpha-acetyltransferase 38, NatC auxiliary subunit-like [Uloborus diversus]|uniref:N-alpha-acetyltransferase 38, NatC auxiliary subunit-like n=1 Tax=Uloborus diversus TaxID=327109 RepID=UPI00240A56F0|nr:N-alpha-acetyltransferase 38, NatC auxiliary subunit-like [Uloborus diversus]